MTLNNDTLIKAYENLVHEQAETIRQYQELLNAPPPSPPVIAEALLGLEFQLKHGKALEADTLKMTDEDRRKFFAARLKMLRKALGLKLSDVADKMGVTPQAVSIYESGKREPGLKNLIALSRILNTTTDWLLGESHIKKN